MIILFFESHKNFWIVWWISFGLKRTVNICYFSEKWIDLVIIKISMITFNWSRKILQQINAARRVPRTFFMWLALKMYEKHVFLKNCRRTSNYPYTMIDRLILFGLKCILVGNYSFIRFVCAQEFSELNIYLFICVRRAHIRSWNCR